MREGETALVVWRLIVSISNPFLLERVQKVDDKTDRVGFIYKNHCWGFRSFDIFINKTMNMNKNMSVIESFAFLLNCLRSDSFF